MSSHHWFVHSFVSQLILLGICCTLNTHSGALLGEPVIFPNELVKCRIELDWQPRQVSSMLCSASVLCNLRQETPPLFSISVSKTRAGKPVISSYQASIFKHLPLAFTINRPAPGKALKAHSRHLDLTLWEPVAAAGRLLGNQCLSNRLDQRLHGPAQETPTLLCPSASFWKLRLIREESRCQS